MDVYGRTALGANQASAARLKSHKDIDGLELEGPLNLE